MRNCRSRQRRISVHWIRTPKAAALPRSTASVVQSEANFFRGIDWQRVDGFCAFFRSCGSQASFRRMRVAFQPAHDFISVDIPYS